MTERVAWSLLAPLLLLAQCMLRGWSLSMIDIGANLLDPMFQGVYHGSQKHPTDLASVLGRAFDDSQAFPLSKILVTAGSLQESKDAAMLCAEGGGGAFGEELDAYRPHLFHTVGVHPTRSSEFWAGDVSPEEHLDALRELASAAKQSGKGVAIGEAGLDYARLQFSPKEQQLKAFELQLALAEEAQLPMFLHDRETEGDFIRMLTEHRSRLAGGVVHSFTGTLEEAKTLVDLDLSIGINGCSLKTEENLQVVRWLPADKIMLETDAPWCGIRPTHAGFRHVSTTWPAKDKKKWNAESCVKGRCEPCHMTQVLEVVCAVRGEGDMAAFAQQTTENANAMFFVTASSHDG